jgi:hypothetical protein
MPWQPYNTHIKRKIFAAELSAHAASVSSIEQLLFEFEVTECLSMYTAVYRQIIQILCCCQLYCF